MPERIFVYGILMRDAREAAILPGYRLTFDGFATIEPDEDSEVLGGVIEATEDQLRHYDAIEGYRPWAPQDGYYRRIKVQLADGSLAWAYRMNQPRERAPDPDLIARMQHEYERLGHTVAA